MKMSNSRLASHATVPYESYVRNIRIFGYSVNKKKIYLIFTVANFLLISSKRTFMNWHKNGLFVAFHEIFMVSIQ